VETIRTAVALLLILGPRFVLAATPDNGCGLSPTALAATKDGQTLFVACATANRVLRLDLETRRMAATIPTPAPPTGLALSADEAQLFVTCAAPQSKVCIVDLRKGKLAGEMQAGHTAVAPVPSADGKTLFVCNRFDNDVSVIDLQTRKELARIPVQREPVAAAQTADGKFLLVANLLPAGRADADHVGAVVSIIDIGAGRVAKELQLPDGSTSLHDLRVSPDGQYAVVAHTISRFRLPADQVERGWMNVNALTLIELRRMTLLNTVLLDDPDSGAANPWGLAWSTHGDTLLVAHAGTHEISIINFPALVDKLTKLPLLLDAPPVGKYGRSARVQADVPNDLTFMAGLRERIRLPEADRGPRAVAVAGAAAYVANYFSDTLSAVNLGTEARAESIPLGPRVEMSAARQGEFYFHDATLCRQGWQSCSTCHPGDARADGLNWDLLNDGVGNPKNTKSLLLVHQTPPCSWLGARGDVGESVRAGIKHILFSDRAETIAPAIEEYLKSLKPVPSPALVNGKLSKAARRGHRVFQRAGCAACHPPGLFTDLRQYNVGTIGAYDQPSDRFDTPSLVELWRTAPYLHDGSAATVRDVVTRRNPCDQHGKTSNLTTAEIDDLCAYLRSL
jgi:YVTN family beta-propeller protein